MSPYTNITCKVLAASVLLGISTGSLAQWQWRDNSGRMTFSDTAPPANIPAKNIIKQPGGSSPTAVVEVGSSNTETKPLAPRARASAAAVAASGAASAPGQQTAENKKKEAEEAAKRKAAEEQMAKAKAENCQRARTSLATLKSGVRATSSVNEKGEAVVMDNAARSAEEKRLNEAIASNCN